jgi:hypothetical protein
VYGNEISEVISNWRMMRAFLLIALFAELLMALKLEIRNIKTSAQ